MFVLNDAQYLSTQNDIDCWITYSMHIKIGMSVVEFNVFLYRLFQKKRDPPFF